MVFRNIQIGNTGRDIKTIKKEVEILELKRTITEIKNSLGVLNRRLEMLGGGVGGDKPTKRNKNKIKKIKVKKE